MASMQPLIRLRTKVNMSFSIMIDNGPECKDHSKSKTFIQLPRFEYID